MARVIYDEQNLFLKGERVDLDTLCVDPNIDIDSLCRGGIDTADLMTEIGEALLVYRADTTRITVDNTSLTADYSR